jgi:hypothetical protein
MKQSQASIIIALLYLIWSEANDSKLISLCAAVLGAVYMLAAIFQSRHERY